MIEVLPDVFLRIDLFGGWRLEDMARGPKVRVTVVRLTDAGTGSIHHTFDTRTQAEKWMALVALEYDVWANAREVADAS